MPSFITRGTASVVGYGYGYSPSLISFNPYPTPFVSTYTSRFSVTVSVQAANGNIVMVGQGNSTLPFFSYSTNGGSTWTTPASIGYPSATSPIATDMAVTPGGVVLAVGTGSSPSLSWYNSAGTNGTSWNTISGGFSDNNFQIQAVLFATGLSLWVGVGYSSSTNFSQYVTSTVGSAPNAVGSIAGSSGYLLCSLAYNGTTLIAVGPITGGGSVSYHSTNGTTWGFGNLWTSPSPINFTAIAYITPLGLWLAVGQDSYVSSTTYQAGIYVTATSSSVQFTYAAGSTITTNAAVNGSTIDQFYFKPNQGNKTIAFSSIGIIVVLGTLANGAPAYTTSIDATNWTWPRTLNTTTPATDLTAYTVTNISSTKFIIGGVVVNLYPGNPNTGFYLLTQ